ncbi:1199_t:CDS:2, partial [Dentiscutata erythropus]
RGEIFTNNKVTINELMKENLLLKANHLFIPSTNPWGSQSWNEFILEASLKLIIWETLKKQTYPPDRASQDESSFMPTIYDLNG